MSGTNPVATWSETNNATQNATAYKATLDGNSAVAQRIVDAFAPHAAGTPNMTVLVDAGHVFTGTTLTEKAQQTSATIVAPTGSNNRIDRIVGDRITGTISVVAGTPTTGAAAPPAIPAGKFPIAQTGNMTVATTAITNAMIIDERDLSTVGWPGEEQVTLASATTTDLGTALTNNVIISGTATITSLGSSASTEFPLYYIKFSGALTLTYNASSLIVPGSANITTAANDSCVAQYLGSGNWQIVSYQPASGKAVVSPVVALTVGTTAINSGNTGRVVYDNGGVVGEYAISGTGSVAMTNSPTLVTPALGTPASGNLSNCTNIPAPIFTALGVGSIILALNSGGAVASGATTAASNLATKGFSNNGAFESGGDSLTGTWQALQANAGNGTTACCTTLWQRTV